MNFYQKHTYLIWQLIGWGLVLAAFIVLLVNLNDYNHDYILGSVVFLTMFGTFAIFVSPLVIWLRKRDKAEQERNRCIIELHSKLHPVQEVISVLFVIFIFFAATIAIARLGLFFLFPLGFYLAAVPYLLHRYIVKKKFYQIPDAEKYCQTFELTQPEGDWSSLSKHRRLCTSALFPMTKPCGSSTIFTVNAARCGKNRDSAWCM